MNKPKRIEYLVAQRRAEIDYAQRSRAIAERDLSRRHARQAEQHERNAAHLGREILEAIS